MKVCELYCGGGLEAERWEEAQIGHYIGIGTAPTFPLLVTLHRHVLLRGVL